MNKFKKNCIISGLLLCISVIYTLLVKFVDVAAIGPNNSKVGFSSINESLGKKIGQNMDLYDLTDKLGYVLLAVVGIYGLIGLVQLIKRKGIFKVDHKILALGGLYVITLFLYVFFEKCIINYRPIILDGKLEASFPSSHTILSLVIGASAIIINKYLIKNKTVYLGTSFILGLLMSLVLFGRLLSGAHWVSDIVGGIIMSITLIQMFRTSLIKINEAE